MRTTPHHRPLAALVGLTLAAGIFTAATAPASEEAVVHVAGAVDATAGGLVASPAVEGAASTPTTGVDPATADVSIPPTAAPTSTAPTTAPAARPPAARPPATTRASTPAPAPAPAPPASAPAQAPQPAAAPRPAPAPQPAPAPAPAPARAESAEERVARAYEAGVPGTWRQNIAARFELIDGDTSWAHTNGLIQIARRHTEMGFEVLVDLIAHEFGHLVAYRYGSGEYVGAPPKGWPAPASQPAEAWADCVQRAFTGRATSTHGQAPCDGEPLRWASSWLASSPSPR